MKLSRDKTILRQIEASDIDENGYFKVPDSVIVIGEKACAHKNVRQLLKVLDINNTKEVCLMAFSDCIHLETVVGSPERIDRKAFMGCVALKSIDLSKVTALESDAFSHCGMITVDISNVNIIGAEAFYACCKLESVICTPNIIGAHAFQGCVNLAKINLSAVKVIGECAFASSGLQEIDISNTKTIERYAFSFCKNLTKVIGAPEKVRRCAFKDCPNLQDFDFSNIKILDHGAFSGTGLEENRCVIDTNTHTWLNYKGSVMEFARYAEHCKSTKISDVIDEQKMAYTDETGTPFIFDENGKNVSMNEQKELFLEIWNSR